MAKKIAPFEIWAVYPCSKTSVSAIARVFLMTNLVRCFLRQDDEFSHSESDQWFGSADRSLSERAILRYLMRRIASSSISCKIRFFLHSEKWKIYFPFKFQNYSPRTIFMYFAPQKPRLAWRKTNTAIPYTSGSQNRGLQNLARRISFLGSGQKVWESLHYT